MLENLNTFANLIQIASYQEILKETSNDELFEELQHQNKQYLEQILENQTEIIRRLERLENERKTL
jgi:tRNA A37 N6-isopentenylltransferase MiaA